MLERKCKICDIIFYVEEKTMKRGIYCSTKCYGISKKGKPSWNKGLTKETDKRVEYYRPTTFKKGRTHPLKGKKRKFIRCKGRLFIYQPDNPCCYRDGYILNSRFKMEKHIKRSLMPTEVIHHIDGDYTNDKMSNLMLLRRNDHSKLHNQLRRISKK